MNVYFPCRRDAFQTPKKCTVKHASLLYMEYMVSIVIPYLVRLVGYGRVSYVEAKQRELRLAGIVYKVDQENSAERSSSILFTDPKPAVRQLYRWHRCHHLICDAVINYCTTSFN